MSTDLVESTLSLLQAMGRYASTPEQHEALGNSKLVLHFIQGRGEAGEFTDYVKGFNTKHPPAVLSFSKKDEADTWLNHHPAPPHGVTIGVADDRYSLAYSREHEHRKLLRLPSKEEWARMDGVEREAREEVEQKPRPPDPGHEKKFEFFGFSKWNAFHIHELEQRLSSSEQREALRVTKIAFDFVMHVGEYHGFEEYRETLLTSSASPPTQTFVTRGEADSWLATQPEPPTPERVAIGGDLYSVGYNRLKRVRVMIRIPAPQELSPGR